METMSYALEGQEIMLNRLTVCGHCLRKMEKTGSSFSCTCGNRFCGGR